MEYKNLLTDLKDNILTVTLNRPKALNALNQQTFMDLRHLFEEYAPTITNLSGIILTGAGEKSFVAGADIKEFTDLNKDQAKQLSKNGQDIFFLIENFKHPVIAAVNGFALGGGCELAMACHMRIAGGKARFGQPEVNLGIIPGYGGTQRLIQYIGKGKAIELMLTGDMIGAEEAYRLGLVNHVVQPGEELEKAREILLKIASKAPIAVSKVLECVNAYFNKKEDGYSREINEFANTSDTEDFTEGATAFIERRTPDFKGK